MNVWVVIPTYNESENIEIMVDTVLDQLDWSSALPQSAPGTEPRDTASEDEGEIGRAHV